MSMFCTSIWVLNRHPGLHVGRGGHVHSWRESSEDLGAQGDVEPGAVACQAHQEKAGTFKDVSHFEPSCVEGPHVQALQKRRDTCLRLGAVAGEERVQGLSSARTPRRIE